MSAEPVLISGTLFENVLHRARTSPRRRANYNFHENDEANPHRFLNVMLADTYVTPHRHRTPPKSESFLVLRGQIAFFTFEDDGRIRSCHVLGEDRSEMGIDIKPGVWHTLAVLSDYAVCYEVKPGPYRSTDDKEFAVWAPLERAIRERVDREIPGHDFGSKASLDQSEYLAYLKEVAAHSLHSVE